MPTVNVGLIANGDGGSPLTSKTVQRRVGTGTWGTLATVAGTTLTYADTTAALGTQYGYRHSVTNAIGTSPFSAEVTITPAEAQATVTGFDNAVVTHGGGYVTSLTNGARYARTDVGGAYRYDAAGDKWAQLITATGVPSPQQSDYSVDAIASAPSNSNVVYVTVGDSDKHPPYPLLGRVLRSSDSGTTWIASPRLWDVRGNAEYRYATVRLAVHPTDPNTVLLGTRFDGLHRSTDGGATWTKLTTLPTGTNLSDLGVTCVAYDPTDTTRIWAGVTGVGLCLSTNGGTSWTTPHAFTTGYVKDLVVTPSGTAWACFYPLSGSGSVQRITKAGTKTTVTPPTAGRNYSSVAVDPTNEARVIVCDAYLNNDGGRFYRTGNATDPAPAWTEMGVELTVGAKGTQWATQATIGNLDLGNARFGTDGALWLSGGMGVHRTADLADTASTMAFTSDGIEELVANAAVKPPGKPLVTATWDRGLWQHPDPTNRNPSPAQAARLPYLTQFGSAWDVVASPTDPLLLAAILNDHQDASGNTFPARKASARSTDGGDTWTKFGSLSATHSADLMFGNIAISAGTGTNRDNWVWVPSNLPDGSPKAYYTTNGGGSWTAGTLPVAAGDQTHPAHFLKRRVLVAHPTTPGTFYLLGNANATGNPILWRTTNGGATWTKLTTTGLRAGFYDFRFNSHLVTDGTYLYALPGKTDGGDRPMFRAPLTDVTTWTQLTGLLNAHDLGVGAPLGGQTIPTLWSYGRKTASGTDGLHYSTNLGAAWTLAKSNPQNLYDSIACIAGDPEVAGRVYWGWAGNGYGVGQLGGTSNLSAPLAPTVGTVVAGNGNATVPFTPSAAGDPADTYTATSTPGNLTATGTTGPLMVTGLTNGTAYTFRVTATNTAGTSSPSAASNSVTPSAPVVTTRLSSTFEDGALGGWAASSATHATVTNATDQFADGARSLKSVRTATAGGNNEVKRSGITLGAGATHTLTLKVRLSSARGLYIYMDVKDGGGGYLAFLEPSDGATLDGTATPADTWATITRTFVVPANGATGDLIIRHRDSLSGEIMWLDTVTLTG